MNKRCSYCREIKLKSEFHKCNSNADGLQFICIECRKKLARKRYEKKRKELIAYTVNYRKKHKQEWLEYSKRYRIENKEIIRQKKIFKQYGLTPEDYEKLFLEQNKECAICKKKDFEPKIDHCHVSNKIRGILCNKCNMVLGAFDDNIFLFKSAIKYLNDKNNPTNS